MTGLKPDSKGKFKAYARWMGGVYLGMRDRTDEYLIGTPEGVIKVHTISRTQERQIISGTTKRCLR